MNEITINSEELNTIKAALWLIGLDVDEEIEEKFHSVYRKIDSLKIDYKRPGLFTLKQEEAQ